MKIFLLIQQLSIARLRCVFLGWILMGMAMHEAGAQQILKDVIVGDDVACPGLSNQYHIGLDLYFPMNIQWRIIEGPGEFVGSAMGESVEIRWETTDRGYTKLVMFAVSYYPPLGLVDTITIHVDKDLNRMNLNCINDLVLDFGMDCERYIDINEIITNGKIKCEDDFEFTLELENLSIPNPVPKRYNGRTFVATLTHKQTGQFCRSNITLGDFSGPRLICKNDTVLCSDPRAYDPKNILFGRPEVIADCNENYTLKVNEYKWVNVENDPFIEGYIERVWRATDQNGNFTDCVDTVFLQKIIFDEIVCPADTQITCDSMELLEKPLVTGSPTFNGQPIYSEDPYCKVYVTYDDQSVPGCGGSKTVYRTWTITSYEDGGFREKSCTQVIEVIDTTGPKMVFNEEQYTLESHSNIPGIDTGRLYPTFYRNAITDNCEADGDFPIPGFVQECSAPDELVINIKWADQQIIFNPADKNPDVRFRKMTIGSYMVEYSAMDDCGNIGKDTIVLVLRDKKPPTIVLDDDPGVVLTHNQYLSWADVSSLDEGSFDNCELEIILARRVDWKTSCGFSADTSVASEVRKYYDQFAEKMSLRADLCLDSLVDYGWTDKIPFCCEDVCGDGVLVEFLAIDAFCNYSKLVTRVQVSDRSQPVVKHKLPNISMNCYTYHTYYREAVDSGNTEVFGKYVTNLSDREVRQLELFECSNDRTTPYVPTVVEVTDGVIEDNCNVIIEERFEENIGICGEGYVERIFTISNPCSSNPAEQESIQVIQRIFITKDCRLRPEDFVLPYTDTTLINCTLLDVEPSGPVLYRDEFCKDLGMTFTDEVTTALDGKTGICYTIKRTWEISDWCESDPYYLPEFVQYIYIKNTEGPTVHNGRVDDICIERGCNFSFSRRLEITDDCTPLEDLMIIWRIDQKIDGDWVTRQSGVGVQINSIALNSGDYRLIVDVTDQCHNRKESVSEFKVGYCSALSISGPESITFNLNSGSDQLRLSDIPYKVNHPCPEADYDVRLRYKGEGLVDNNGNLLPPLPGSVAVDVPCARLGSNMIELWVVDENGNAGFYVLQLDVKDPRGLCPNSGNQLIGGIKSPDMKPISDVEVRLNGPIAEIRRNMTNLEGQFNLGSFPSTNESLSVVPTKTDNPLNGITAFDVLTIFRIASNKMTLTTPYEKIAADINGDGIVSVIDVLMIQALLLQKVKSLPGPQWIFINSDMQPVSRIRANDEYRSKLHFTGVKRGDVNYSATIRSSNRHSMNRAELVFGEAEFHNGFIRIPVEVGTDHLPESMQFALHNGNTIPWIAVESGRLQIGSDDYEMDEQSMKMVWYTKEHIQADDIADFYLVFDHNPNVEIDPEKITLSMDLSPEIYDGKKLNEHLRLVTAHHEAKFEVSGPYPNPFSNEVKFDLSGKTGKLLRTEVYSLSGQLVHYEKIDQERIQYRLDGSSLPTEGFYMIRFVLESGVVNRKLYYIP